jgi:hypothetical protein
MITFRKKDLQIFCAINKRVSDSTKMVFLTKTDDYKN